MHACMYVCMFTHCVTLQRYCGCDKNAETFILSWNCVEFQGGELMQCQKATLAVNTGSRNVTRWKENNILDFENNKEGQGHE